MINEYIKLNSTHDNQIVRVAAQHFEHDTHLYLCETLAGHILRVHHEDMVGFSNPPAFRDQAPVPEPTPLGDCYELTADAELITLDAVLVKFSKGSTFVWDEGKGAYEFSFCQNKSLSEYIAEHQLQFLINNNQAKEI